MTAVPAVRAAAGATRVNVYEEWELTYWAELLGTTAAELEDIVRTVGPEIEAVRPSWQEAPPALMQPSCEYRSPSRTSRKRASMKSRERRPIDADQLPRIYHCL